MGKPLVHQKPVSCTTALLYLHSWCNISVFFTTRARKKVGLGLAFLAQAAQEADGELLVESTKGRGTKVIAIFKLSHIDRKPLGNLEETTKCLRMAHPGVRFCVEHVSTEG